VTNERKGSRGVVAVLALIMGLSIGVAAWALGGSTDVAPADETAAASRRARARGHHRGAGGGTHGGAGSWASTAGDAGVPTRDPQQLAYERSWARYGDAGVGSVPAPDFSPTTHLGVVRAVGGAAPVQEGARCEVRLLPVASSLFNCVVRVTCDDVVLYPDQEQQAGYAPCEVNGGIAMRALDESTTGQDGDPRLEVDVEGRRVRVFDEAPGVPARSTEIGLLRPI